jgi:hypothetical protein
VDSSLAASTWQKYCRALVKKKKGTILATLMAKESYRYDQAAPADPQQANFFRQLPLPRADGLDKVLQNFLVILL